eukprot:3795046-Prymnesium_polylepis.1
MEEGLWELEVLWGGSCQSQEHAPVILIVNRPPTDASLLSPPPGRSPWPPVPRVDWYRIGVGPSKRSAPVSGFAVTHQRRWRGLVSRSGSSQAIASRAPTVTDGAMGDRGPRLSLIEGGFSAAAAR